MASSHREVYLVICGNCLEVNAQRSSKDKKTNIPQAFANILEIRTKAEKWLHLYV